MSHHVSDTQHGHHHAHHFRDAHHEFEASKFGMWLFLVTEILLFGALFGAYIIFQNLYPEMFKEAHHHLDRTLGSINTVVLLYSSFTMALGIYFIQKDNPKASMRMLWLTVFLAATFMVIKYVEYSHKFHEGVFPGKYFTYGGFKAANSALFFSLYFVMTGIHGLHVVIGMGLIFWCMWRMRRGDFNSQYYTAVEMTGLYWHLVDLIWIFLFPLLYLIQ